MVTIKPFGSWILARRMQLNSDSKIVLPDIVKEKQIIGFIVVGIGDDVKKTKIGDRVLPIPQAVVGINLPDIEKDLVLIKEESLFGTIEKVEVA